jgi:glycogen operon protein
MRNRQVKNHLAVTLLSIGVPMILMGDEIRHTQGGNNNAYCQDNEISWFDWSRVAKHADVHRFVRLLIERRLLRDVEHEQRRVSLTTLIEQANKAWHGVKLFQPDWGDQSRSVAFGAELRAEGIRFHLILNAYWKPLEFELPKLDAGDTWRRWIDTALESPDDIVPWRTAPAFANEQYHAQARSFVMLYAGGDR